MNKLSTDRQAITTPTVVQCLKPINEYLYIWRRHHNYLYNDRFQQEFWSDDFLAKLGAPVPMTFYQEKLLKHFFHRSYVYFVRLDKLSPSEHRETALRARISTNMSPQTNSMATTGRSYGDQCLRCKQVWQWKIHFKY